MVGERTLPLQSGETLVPDIHADYTRLSTSRGRTTIWCTYKPWLNEDKASPARHGVEDPLSPFLSMATLSNTLLTAMKQVEDQAGLHFYATRTNRDDMRQQHIILTATCGGIFVVAWAEREWFSELSAVADDRDAFSRLLTLANDKRGAPVPRKESRATTAGVISPLKTFVEKFHSSRNRLTSRTNTKIKWIGPFCLDTTPAVEVLLDIRKCLETFTTAGTMTNLLRSQNTYLAA